MFAPAVALPNLLTPVPPAQAAVLTTASSDAAIGRLPVFAVPGPIALPEAHNYAHGGGGGISGPPAAASGESAAASILPGYPAARSLLANGPSSAFLAQLFGQSATGGAQELADFFATPERLNIFDSATLVRFSNVKYLPSEAAKPRYTAPPTQPFVEVRRAAPPTVQEEVQRVATAQRQTVEKEIAAPSAASAAERGTQAAAVTPRAAGDSAVRRHETPAAGKKEASASRAHDSSARPLYAEQGVNAYLATLSRNAANLNAPEITPVKAVV